MAIKAHIYSRVSSRRGKSTNSQIEECIRLCKEKKWEIKGIYAHIESSRNMANSDKLNEIISNMSTGDILVIYSVDRFSRSVMGGLSILSSLEKKGIGIYSVEDRISYENIYDKFRFRDIMNHSELETDRISLRVKNSKRIMKMANNNEYKSINSNHDDVINKTINKYYSSKKRKI